MNAYTVAATSLPRVSSIRSSSEPGVKGTLS